ncbi:TRAP transporter small permease [Sutcliffiella rhizosphaerae]|uniref:Ectoine/5-hydroxyectoine TRAP transporter small permease protein UehB n=1 Tax=Sutcliffiella rhizosphaerae TaxID=2880967 RepID=A0ABM8YRV9_9BACI|nr:TRAP transporter small permease [Sutcliffiella rhizosphaerae]CAG9622733.1 Ectoine/5-hydroxyectoine TRAP transporter small permease protein UehB [Sutcliffiella rhizosphaerae]
MGILVKLEEWILITLMAVICVLTFGNVISRHLFHTSFSFTEELTTNLFAFIIFIGAALLARENGHLGFSLLTDYLSDKYKIVVLILVGCLTTFFFLVILWYGMGMVMQQFTYNQRTPAMGLPEWIMGFSVPLGAFLCIFRFWEGYLIEWKRIKAGGELR